MLIFAPLKDLPVTSAISSKDNSDDIL
jgi:hypothetical protein